MDVGRWPFMEQVAQARVSGINQANKAKQEQNREIV